MSKERSDALFHLIHSLSRSEKRYFKLYAARTGEAENRKFIRLFDAIERQSEYNEEKILEREPSLQPAQLSNMKAHLYVQVLKAVSLFNQAKMPDAQIRELLDNAQLLYNKCLYQQSIRILDKAKRLATRHERSSLLLNIIELEKLALNQTVDERNIERVNKIVTETEQLAESIRNLNSFSNLSLKLDSFYVNVGHVRNRKDYQKVKTFFHASLPHYHEKQLTFSEKIYLYYSFTGYHFFVQDYRAGYRYAKKMVKLFDANPERIENNLEMYIRSLNNLLIAQNKLMRYEEFHETQKKLTTLKRFPKKLLNENVNLNLFRTIYIHEINRHFMLGEFRSGTRIVNALKHELDLFIPKLDKHHVFIFYYKIACLYVGSSNFRQALVWLNKIINSREVDVREDLHAFARILNLVCHYELGNTELMEYAIKSTYRFLLTRGDLST